MARLPDTFLQDLLSRTDIVEVIGSRIELKRAGKEYKGLSPFTNEKSPSFFVSPAKQMFFDFSSGKSGTAITFLMEFDRLGFRDAVDELAKRAGIEVPTTGGHSPALVLDGPLDALAVAERHFKAQLRANPPAVEYLKSRGVSGETAKLYGIGYAPDSWNSLSRQFPDPTHALTAGLVKRKEETGRVFDVFRNRVMFPIRDLKGRVIAFGGRTLANDPAKYLNSPETPLFHKGKHLFGLYEAKQSSKSELPYIIVVEGYMDTVMLAQHGIRNVVATLGTATTTDHLRLIFKSTSKVVFCFDGDRAGRSAAWRALEQIVPELDDSRECRFMFLPEGHDPDTLVQEIGPDAFRERVEEALPLTDFLLNGLSLKIGTGHIEKARLVTLAQPYMSRMRQGGLRSRLVVEIALRAGLNQQDVQRVLDTPDERPQRPVQRPGLEGGIECPTLVRRALQALFERPELALKVNDIDQLAALDEPGVNLLVSVLENFSEHEGLTVANLLEQWRDTREATTIQQLLGFNLDFEPAALESEFIGAIESIRRLAIKRKVKFFADKARTSTLTPQEVAEWQLLLASSRKPEV